MDMRPSSAIRLMPFNLGEIKNREEYWSSRISSRKVKALYIRLKMAHAEVELNIYEPRFLEGFQDRYFQKSLISLPAFVGSAWSLTDEPVWS
jgi:hypothetical protein